MMRINFNITPFDLKGMLQHIFDCLYITDKTSDTTHRIFMNAMGITHLFFIILVFKFALDWSNGGTMSFVFFCYWLPQKGATIVGRDIFTDALFWRIMLCRSSNSADGLAKMIFPFKFQEELAFASPVCTMCMHVWSPSSESVIRLKLFLPCLEVVEPLALVRRWRTESGLWWRVESWNAWKVLMDRLVKRNRQKEEWK